MGGHLNEINMTYFEHFFAAMGYSKRLMTGSFKTIIHAFFPDIFITATTDTINDVTENMRYHIKSRL